MEILDLNGAPIVEGDVIAGAFRTGNIAELRVGTVLGFGERGNKVTVKVRWKSTSLMFTETIDIVGEIEAGLFRFVKIGG